jgi:hypothetical protein
MEASMSLQAYRNCTELLEKHLVRSNLFAFATRKPYLLLSRLSAKYDSTGTNLLALPGAGVIGLANFMHD